jgi:hypothetical protein
MRTTSRFLLAILTLTRAPWIARAQQTPPTVSLGAVRVEPDPTVYAQAVIDMEGRFRRAVAIGGPASLIPAALESLEQWRARPARMNGAPVVQPIVLQIQFR